MSWSALDRSVLRHKILEEREERTYKNQSLIKKSIDEALSKAKAKGKREAFVVFGSSILCEEADCGFVADLSSCHVCSQDQRRSFMVKWYTYQADRLSRLYKLDVRFGSIASGGGRQRIKGRLTKAQFVISISTLRTFETDPPDDEDVVLPPLPPYRPSHVSPKPVKSKACVIC